MSGLRLVEAILMACKANGARPVQVSEAALRVSEEELAAEAKESAKRVMAELRKLPRKARA